MNKIKVKHIITVLLAACMPVLAAWQLVSEYRMDGDYSGSIPGSGTALIDSGPAGNHLYTVDIGGSYNQSQPSLVSPGSDGSGNSFRFDASQADTLHANWSINIMNGFQVTFYFKESGAQTNGYPRFCRIEKDGLISPGGFKVEGVASAGKLTRIDFWVYPGDVKCSVSGSWDDGLWHYVTAVYDPADGQIRLTVDGVSSSASYSGNFGFVPDKLKLGYPYDNDILERGFDGEIDSFKVYERAVTYMPYTTYYMDGTYDRIAGTGTSLADSGPISSNSLAHYTGGSQENTPTQITQGYDGEALEFDGISPQLLRANFSMDMSSGFIGKLKFKTDVVPDPVQAYPYLLRMSGGSALLLQGMYQADPNRFDNISMSFAGGAPVSIAAPGGLGWNDNQWHSVTFGFEPGAANGWTFVKIDGDARLESYRTSASAVQNNTIMTIGATESLNNRYGYSGVLDEIEFYYAVLATEVLSPASGDILYWDEKYHIVWEADVHLSSAKVKLEYSGNDGASWNTISMTSNTGNYIWTVPQITETDQCLIRLSNVNDANIVYAVSGEFTVLETCNLTGDLTGDCYLDFEDFTEMASYWLFNE